MADLPSDFTVDKNPVDSAEVDVISEPELDFFGKPKVAVIETPDVETEEILVELADGLIDDGNDLVVEEQVEAILNVVTGSCLTREEARATGKPYHRELQPNGTFLWIIEG